VYRWTLTLTPFLPGEETIPPVTFRLFSTTDPSLDPVTITSEPITITVTSVLEGADDFVPGTLPEPPEPLEALTPPTPAWAWFIAGSLTMGVVALGVFILRRPENEATIRRRQLQSIRAQLALIDADSPSLDHLREAHRLLIQLESLTPHAYILASLVADSQSIASRLSERAIERREAS
jgi:hypothetical protein